MKCRLCPRACETDREVSSGLCGADIKLKIARAAPHYWEEPCISGKNGSGTVFFSGCQLHCVYCQNREISDGKTGKYITEDRLLEIFYELADKGVHNINLVTPDPYIPAVARTIRKAKTQGFSLPFLMNCSGYETVESLRLLEGCIDIYMPDWKYSSPILAKKYSLAPDYAKVCRNAIAEMVRQCPRPVYDKDGMMKSGVLIRHLLIPGCVEDSEKIIAEIYHTYGGNVRISLMRQFTPFGLDAYPEINRTVTDEEYDRLLSFAWKLGIRNAYMQDGESVAESFIPPFDLEGV